MHILHGSWLINEKQFAFWGEDTANEPQQRKGRRGKTAPHPFQISTEHLLHYIDRFTTDSYPDGKLLTIWLPGFYKQVQPSPEAAAAGVPPLEAVPEFLGWEINTMTLPASDFLDFMLQLPVDGRGFTLGGDLRYWQQVALLIMNCMVEGRFIPRLEQRGSQYYADWELRPDVHLVDQLQVNMPPLCRAISHELYTAPQPADLLHHYMDALLDTFIRENYKGKYRAQAKWINALTSPDRQLAGIPNENRKLYQEWEQWQAVDEAALGFRVCYRLEEPRASKGSWQLTYLLQASDDPSLLVEAKKVWASKGDQLEYLEHRFRKPQEKLLEALGRASRIFPPIERSLRGSKPTGVALEAREAYQFLLESAAPLEANGYTVLVPNWWHHRSRPKAKAKIKRQNNEASGFLTRDALLGYEWEVSLGDQAISFEEFEQLVRLKQPLVQYRGNWVLLDPDHVDALTQFIQQSPEGEINLLDALRMTAGSAENMPDEVEIATAEVQGWLAEFFERLQNPEKTEQIAPPDGLRATLRPYQERGLGWLVQMDRMQLGACLADDMGLGKTLQTIAYWLHNVQQGRLDRPALLVCPTSVVGNWSHEIARFAPQLRYLKQQGADRLQGESFVRAANEAQIVLTSYALLHRDLDTLRQINWSSVVLDEAQNIKNPSTKQAQAARALQADQRIALTGTPVENRLTELWSIFEFLNQGYLGSQKAFKASFATPIERYQDKEAAAALRKMTAPFLLRRVKTDPHIIQDLPEKFENKVYCSLTPEQATLYEATVRDEMTLIENAEDEMERRGSILRMLIRLKQICNHPAQFLKEGEQAQMQHRSGKLVRLVEMLEEIQDMQEKALIFTQYAEMGGMLQRYLRDYFTDEALFLHGGTPAPKREEMVRMFQASGGPPIFILSLKAGGTGLNLTSANHVFHYDRWYNPAVENQATDRAFRIGQTKNVQVHKYICLGTLEERIDELIEHKQALADQIIGEGESWISEMSNAELREMVTLRREVMED